MEEFNIEIFRDYLYKSTEKLKVKDSSYVDDIYNACSYWSKFFLDSEVNRNLIFEIEKKISLLSLSNLHSKQNLELFKDLSMSLELLHIN